MSMKSKLVNLVGGFDHNAGGDATNSNGWNHVVREYD